MSRIRQESFLPGFDPKNGDIAYGGDYSEGKRKEKRPFDRKQALHVVLRSSKARGGGWDYYAQHCRSALRSNDGAAYR